MPQAIPVQVELFAHGDKRHDAFQDDMRGVSKANLPTNTTTDRYPIHRWFNFIAGFSPEFVHQCCLSLQPPCVLLDPFGGCGTAALVAKQRGMDSISFDPHPVFARIARAKLQTTNVDEVEEIQRAIISGLEGRERALRNPLSNEADRFLRKLFDFDVLQSLLRARDAVMSTKFRQSELAFLMLSKVVEMSTHSQTDGIYKAPTSKKRALSPISSCSAIANLIRRDLLTCSGMSRNALPRVFEESSTAMFGVKDHSVDVVVTSPPYLNNFDYAEMTRMLIYFWGIADSWADITLKVRSRLIVNTTTALKGHKEKQSFYRSSLSPALLCKLDPLVEQLAWLRTQRPGKKEYDFLIYPYFSQMTDVLRECHRCLKNGCAIHLMVADAALYGVHISTPQFLIEILEHIGFRSTNLEFVRKRGHRWILSKRKGSATGLGEYHISGVK